MNVSLKKIRKAEQLLKDYKVCGNWNGRDSGHGCNKVFETKELIQTVGYGQIYHWCPKCYEKIKED